jgi:hypothetical protein
MSPAAGETRPLGAGAGIPSWLVATIAVLMAVMGLLISPLGESLLDMIQQRAAVSMDADFRSAPEGWVGGRDRTRPWTREQNSIRVAHLMLHRPSMRLTDYRFEFVGQIHGRGLGWVVRASDLRNYYVSRLIAARPGAAEPLILERSVVVSGEEAHRVQVPVRERFDVRKPMRIEVEVSGSDFRTSIDGRVVDFFHDDLLTSGGVGFTGEPEDRPRIFWMRVRHHDDLLGKVSAWLSPGA